MKNLGVKKSSNSLCYPGKQHLEAKSRGSGVFTRIFIVRIFSNKALKKISSLSGICQIRISSYNQKLYSYLKYGDICSWGEKRL